MRLSDGFVDLQTLARVLREARPVSRPTAGGSYQHGFAAGADSAREHIARNIADYLELDTTERGAFFRAAHTSD